MRIPVIAVSTLPVLLAMCSVPSSAIDLPLTSGTYAIPIVSMREARLKSTTIQQFDFSCGSAALATILTYQYGYHVSEQAVFEEMFRNGDQQIIRKLGFSLLDMKKYLSNHGFQADGFEQTLDKLQKAKLPAIVLMSDKGYNHFVVIKGIREGRILIGDPARGTRAMSRADFESTWTNKLLFVIHNQTQWAKFNESTDWAAAPSAPVGSANGEQLRIMGAALPRFGPGEF